MTVTTAGRWGCAREGCGRQLAHDARGGLIHVMEDGGYVYVPHAPRLSQEDRHDAQHDLIAMRRRRMAGIPSAGGGRARRQEAWASYLRTLQDHLRAAHDLFHVPLLAASEEELEALHHQAHEHAPEK